jgi:hypothetical protein
MNAPPSSVVISTGAGPVSFALDFSKKRWSTPSAPPEGEFPLTAEIDAKRYELYSDGTFAEVEL